jgi:hypothetical protein
MKIRGSAENYFMRKNFTCSKQPFRNQILRRKRAAFQRQVAQMTEEEVEALAEEALVWARERLRKRRPYSLDAS